MSQEHKDTLLCSGPGSSHLLHTRARLADLDLAKRLNEATLDPTFRRSQFDALVELAKLAAGRLTLRAEPQDVRRLHGDLEALERRAS